MNASVNVDFNKPSPGKVRALHGVNSGPMTKVFTYDARSLFREAGFPYVRLHDVEYPYGSGEFVDIPCVFKDFDADETREESYNFALTDEYIRAIVEVGAKPIFRLGVSIEHAPVKRYIYPPRDYRKWARICEHVIRHYNEGWADGFHWDIRYWEIWNEADNKERNMWLGTPEEFYELYVVSASWLKECFPELMIGGCAYTRAVNSFAEGFFQYIAARKAPLDFYSWHRYFSDIDVVVESAGQARAVMDRYGYGAAESILDEWNYMDSWEHQAESYRAMKNHIGAAHAAAVLCALQQQTDVAVANYFEADVIKEFCGIFNVADMAIGRRKATLCPTKAFYSFLAFHQLYRMGDAVWVDCRGQGIYACAAAGGGEMGLLVSAYNNEDTELILELSGLLSGELEVRLTDEEHTFERLVSLEAGERATLKLTVKKNSVLYIGSAVHHTLEQGGVS